MTERLEGDTGLGVAGSMAVGAVFLRMRRAEQRDCQVLFRFWQVDRGLPNLLRQNYFSPAVLNSELMAQ